jgi:hypothetical protein
MGIPHDVWGIIIGGLVCLMLILIFIIAVYIAVRAGVRDGIKLVEKDRR